MASLLIRGGTVLTMNDRLDIVEGAVSVSGGRIVSVGPEPDSPCDRVVNAGYRFRRDLLEQVDVSAAWPITKRWRGYGRWVYSIDEEKTLDQFVGLEYTSCCWALRVVSRRFVRSRTGDIETTIGLQLELKGLSSVGTDSEAFLRSAIRGYSALPPESRP